MLRLDLDPGAVMLGINNRDLGTFKVDITNNQRIMDSAPGQQARARRIPAQPKHGAQQPMGWTHGSNRVFRPGYEGGAPCRHMQHKELAASHAEHGPLGGHVWQTAGVLSLSEA